jgi:hypothetical protein
MPAFAGTSLVQYGSFEETSAPLWPGWQHYNPGDSVGSGWIVADSYANYGSVDLLVAEWGTPWNVADGIQALDLDGGDAGGVYQDITFTSAGSYTLSFYMAAITAVSGPGTQFNMKVDLGGAVVDSLVAYTQCAGESVSNMTWDYYEYVLSVATPGVQRLEFMSLSSGCCGPAIDDVRLEAVPEPSFLSLGGLLGLGGAFGFRRFRRA